MMYLYEKSKKSVKNVALHERDVFCFLKKENKKACEFRRCVLYLQLTNISRLPRIQKSQNYLQLITNNSDFLFEADSIL